MLLSVDHYCLCFRAPTWAKESDFLLLSLFQVGFYQKPGKSLRGQSMYRIRYSVSGNVREELQSCHLNKLQTLLLVFSQVHTMGLMKANRFQKWKSATMKQTQFSFPIATCIGYKHFWLYCILKMTVLDNRQYLDRIEIFELRIGNKMCTAALFLSVSKCELHAFQTSWGGLHLHVTMSQTAWRTKVFQGERRNLRK